ncbi:MAG: GNVR domain-containing protein [Silvibacterium sp.]
MIPDQENEERSDQENQGSTESALLRNLVILAAQRRLIAGGMVAAALLTAIVVLVMPVTYTATTVILTPQNSSGSILSLLGQFGGLGSIASSLDTDGLIKMPSDTYTSVLSSRTVADRLIQRFQLQHVYRKRTLVDTRKALARHTHIETTRGSTIHISVDDKDVQRATAIANGYVEELYQVNQRLALTSSAQRRLFLEEQLGEERAALAQAEIGFKEIQQKTGVIQLAGQAEITLRSIAQLRAAIAAKEVQVEVVRDSVTDQNSDLVRLESGIAALREQLRKAESESAQSGDDYFVPAGKIPAAGLEYLRRTRDLRYHEALFEMLAKQYEAARIDEAKAPPLVQVIDKAVAPDKRSWPPRTLLVMLAALTSAILLAGAVLLRDKWARLVEEPENVPHLNALRKILRPKDKLA